jgi:hypothetical protein
MAPNEAVMSGFEKLKSMLGSTPTEVDTNELGLEICLWSMWVLVNEGIGTGDMVEKLWNTGVCIAIVEGGLKVCQSEF